MRNIFTFMITTYLILLSGCGFVHDEKITGPYHLIAIDSNEQMSISYDLGNGSTIGRIGKTVFEYGYDKKYIVAKQHPGNNRRITNYYYLNMTKDARHADPSESVVGPLTEIEFNEASQQHNLPEFTRIISHLK